MYPLFSIVCLVWYLILLTKDLIVHELLLLGDGACVKRHPLLCLRVHIVYIHQIPWMFMKQNIFLFYIGHVSIYFSRINGTVS